ncbi:hypothetical protein IMSAGC011_02204 [Lachnospiraceae bacterium]|nr:hypothetical protein IMSAGC011_02204 [Lachnospiraceae bacterium]
MLKIRLMGTKNDIKWFERILQRQPKVAVCRITEYLSKNKRTSGRKKEDVGYSGNRRNYWGYGGF